MTNNATSTRETMGSMTSRLSMPYTLTAGKAMGTFLAELGAQRIIGSRCAACATVRVPAQDFCGDCGAETGELVAVPSTGELTGWTVTERGILAFVLLDGTDVPLLHRIVDTDVSSLVLGARVSARWAAEPAGNVMDITGFAIDAESTVGALAPTNELLAPIEQLAYRMELTYEHSYGHFYGSLFDSVKNDRRIRGIRCPSCRNVLLPPRGFCDVCFVPTKDWIDIPDTGTVQACSVVHIEFVGQRMTPPYVYAEIVLDGTATRLIHSVGGLSAEEARSGIVKPGSRVKAVWSDRATGSLADIEYFQVIDGSA
ncbi:unannotated protein [freshwater metagenome]|uniref:Unannotated protein n=1 Tax=freshwater metagenome TaxID=449393 RepID=A0A6J7IXS9_9ZZZZ|nr:hypothetical protein [Actinomycetota bacterium]MSW36337.1 hypothetical protein [Actinomycetota bacterium]MSX38156.1 hypothetical protein [Actinomycetota bacterium]